MVMKNNLLKTLFLKIEKEEEISPILFVWEDLLSVNLEVFEVTQELLKKFWVDKSSIFRFEDNEEKLKIEHSREIISLANKKSTFKFQIILIENISRLTLSAANSLLKLLEEPVKENIIFLTNSWENNILETILSRVTIERINYKKKFLVDENIFSMLENYFEYDNPDLLTYLYENSKKFEKADYLRILDNMLEFCKKDVKYTDYLEKILELKNWSIKNNFNLKYWIDKILLK